MWLAGVLVLVLGVIPFTLARHVACLLRRVPAKASEDAVWGIAVGVLIMDGCLLPSAVAALLKASSPFAALIAPLGCMALITGAICYVSSVVLLRDARKHFRAAAEQSVVSGAASDESVPHH
jgi:hypothetical protein